MLPAICCIRLNWRSFSVSANFTTRLEEAPWNKSSPMISLHYAVVPLRNNSIGAVPQLGLYTRSGKAAAQIEWKPGGGLSGNCVRWENALKSCLGCTDDDGAPAADSRYATGFTLLRSGKSTAPLQSVSTTKAFCIVLTMLAMNLTVVVAGLFTTETGRKIINSFKNDK